MRAMVVLLALAILPAAAGDTATLVGTVCGPGGEPLPGAEVGLFPTMEAEEEITPDSDERPWLFADEPLHRAETDFEGRYTIEGIAPGSYDVICRHDHYDGAHVPGLDLAAGEERSLDFRLLPFAEVEKPNLYLYPKETTEVTVTLDFPAGGGLTESDPPYGDGWRVVVEPDGAIAGGYGHLFYEARVPADWRFERGWVVQQWQLAEFFGENLAAHGFNERETADFIEHWLPRLDDEAFYVIYPQYSRDIEPLIALAVEPEPDAILRLCYVISVVDSVERYIPEPQIPSFHRSGFTVCEWGVALVEDSEAVR
ncbi:MAG TPA: carboxypeptidase regulatory-like domain-containing protein [Candidatus Coatesbacteria bacterium]|nr:carboxypeptidase regulatory-like domain-containing protein [Candidatus Coatesbacteria bacterium]